MNRLIGPALGEIIKEYMPPVPPYIEIYKDIHQNPELGRQEARTATIAAEHLKNIGYTVHTKIGGHGLVGVLENGGGRTILLRADMDALPVKEETGLPYASKKTVIDSAGKETPVMHACGHDMHTSCLMAVAELMYNARTKWTGILICLFQPDEELGGGAQAMVDGGLYNVIKVPDVILGQHVYWGRSGNVDVCPGAFLAAGDSFKVTIIGRGGHGSQPQSTIDPIVISAYIIVRLQSVISRLISPMEAAVITCGSIHGGERENVIPDRVVFKLNIRTYNESVRRQVLHAVKRIIRDECNASGATEEPIIKPTSSFPVTSNDPTIAGILRTSFKEFFGDEHAGLMERFPGSEDVSNLARTHGIPYVFWFWGGTDPRQWDEANERDRLNDLPRNHSSKFAPVIEPTLSTGIQAFALAALQLFAHGTGESFLSKHAGTDR